MTRKSPVVAVLVVALLGGGIVAALTRSHASPSGSGNTFASAMDDAKTLVSDRCGFKVVSVTQGKNGYWVLHSAEHESNMSPYLKAELQREGVPSTVADNALWDGAYLEDDGGNVWCPNQMVNHQTWDGATLYGPDNNTFTPLGP